MPRPSPYYATALLADPATERRLVSILETGDPISEQTSHTYGSAFNLLCLRGVGQISESGEWGLAYRPVRWNSGGLAMSPRQARFYRWLEIHGVRLNTMSTDGCVLAALPRLRGLREAVEDEMPETCTKSHEWDEVMRDLDALMRRVPQNRSA